MLDRTNIMIRIDAQLKKRVKTACARDEITMTELVVDMLLRYCQDAERAERERAAQE